MVEHHRLDASVHEVNPLGGVWGISRNSYARVMERGVLAQRAWLNGGQLVVEHKL